MGSSIVVWKALEWSVILYQVVREMMWLPIDAWIEWIISWMRKHLAVIGNSSLLRSVLSRGSNISTLLKPYHWSSHVLDDTAFQKQSVSRTCSYRHLFYWPPGAVAWGIPAFLKQTSSMLSDSGPCLPACSCCCQSVSVDGLGDMGRVELKVFSLAGLWGFYTFPSLEPHTGAWVSNVT